MATSTHGAIFIGDGMFSNRAVHPGELLAEELAERGISQRKFAEMIGRPVQAVNEICRGKKAVTADTAIAFERALGVSARLWMNMQTEYALTLAYHRANPQKSAG